MQFYQRNEQAVAEEADRLEKQAATWGNSAPMLYLQPGLTMVRVLPPYGPHGRFFKRVLTHRVPYGSDKQVFIGACARTNGSDTFCAICAKGQEFQSTREEDKVAFARENLKTRERYIYNVLVLSAPANKKGEAPTPGKVYVLEAGPIVHQKIIKLDKDEQTGWSDITSPERGVTLIISRTGHTKNDTKYDVTPHGGGRTNLWTDLQARNIDPNSIALIDLDNVYAIPTEEKLAEVLGGLRAGFSPAPQPQQPVFPVAQPVAVAAAPTPAPAPFVPPVQVGLPVTQTFTAPPQPFAAQPVNVVNTPAPIPVIPPPPGR